MTERIKYPGVYYNDGCIRYKGYVYISGKIKGVDPDEYEFSRAFFYKDPQWGYADFPGWNVISVCASVDGHLFTLISKGELQINPPKGGPAPFRETLPKAIGPVSQIRNIGSEQYVCGAYGQVFRREAGGWTHIDQGIIDETRSMTSPYFNGIDGTSNRDIYVAGYGGRIFHYDGARWDELVSPTNVHLERVHCVSPSEVYFCGNKGTFFKLSNGVFTDHSITSDDHFWGLTSFEGKIYLATLEGLYVFDGTTVRPLDTKLSPPIDGYRLDARDGQLWSFGVEDLAWFDGTTWTRVIHPDNA